MRYVTDEVSEDFVPLQNEIDCINNYIDLQRLRIGKRTEIDYNVTGNATNKIIAPLVFMTFIENIFKYGISKQENSKLVVNINIEDDKVTLFCQNPVYHTVGNNGRRGIGIQNTKQRLEHLYPGKHLLNISNENNLYSVTLTLYS
jgi:LytS/YehU family sensor histidine kinase